MRTLALSILLALPLLSVAQIEKGTYFLGGSILSNGQAPISFRNGQLNLNADVSSGFFVLRNTAVGLRTHTRMGISRRTMRLDLGGDLFMRYYVPVSQRVSLFAEGSFGILNSFNSRNDATYNWFRQDRSLSVGTSIWLTDNLAIEPMVTVSRNRLSSESLVTSRRNISSSVGLHYYFGRGKSK